MPKIERVPLSRASHRTRRSLRSTLHRSAILAGGCGGAVLALVVDVRSAQAFNLYHGTYDGQAVEINLDTTVEYSNFYRINDPSAVLAGPANANGNDGDSDFRHGFVSNEFDVTPVFDLKMGNFGAHVSGEFYLNTSYLGKNQNNQPGTFNPYTPASNRDFTSATRNINGENAKLLDAFLYDGVNFGADGQQTFTVKVGRQTLLWGQSLFFTPNGIAGGQAPVDVIKAESLPNAQTQQVVLPVGQVVVTYQPNATLTFQAYYQFEWEPYNFQGVGAYFSSSDILDKGGQRLILGSDDYLYRTRDNRPNHNGQFGASVQATLGVYDVGLYALRFDAKTPQVYIEPNGAASGNAGDYWLVYARDIQLYGASVSTDIGPANVGAEISGRRNMPLVSGVGVSTVYPGSANAGALYAVGSTVAAQASAIYVSPGVPLDPGGVSVDAEFAMNHVVSVDSGKTFLTPGRNATAGQFEIVVTPTYYKVLPNIDLTFPIGITYNLFGRSQIEANENHGTGTFSFGVTATYRTTWTAGLTYNDYLGAADPSLNPLADRGYLSFNIEHTF